MSRTRSIRNLAVAVERELERLGKAAAGSGHAGGIPLPDLLDRVNTLSERLLPDEESRDARVSRVFTPRAFRHYQTLRCIDPAERDGKQAIYGLRHFVQALLVRKLLWEGAPSDAIVGLMAGRSTDETKGMLFSGIEMVARPTDEGEGSAEDSKAPESWKRVVVRPGIELHLREDLPKPRRGELKVLLAALETALRRSLR